MTDFQRTIPTVRSLALGEAGYLAAAPMLAVPANTLVQDMAQRLREWHQQDTRESPLIVLAAPGKSLPKPIGIVTTDDVAWALLTEPDIHQAPLTALAKPPVTIASQSTLDQAWEAFQGYDGQWLVLVDHHEALTGVISRRAVLEALIHRQSMPPQETAVDPAVDLALLDTDRPPSSPPTAISDPSSAIAAVAVNGQSQDIPPGASQWAWVSQASNDGLWEWDLTTDRLSLSPRWKELLGYQPQELADDWAAWEKVLIADDRPTLASLRQAFQVNQADRIQLIQRFEHKNQTIVHGLVRAVRHRDPKAGDRLLGLLTDISELAQNQQELTNILDSSIDGIAALRSIRNSTGQIVDFLWTTVNTAAETVLQQSRDQLLNRQLVEQIPSVRQDGLFDAY
ncbi:MAG TPA: CBS domain-containing protein, partial [Coleofasciculaceae cyanobacterium]